MSILTGLAREAVFNAGSATQVVFQQPAKAKHRLDPDKLLPSKWTAVQPHNRFLLSELFCDEQGYVLQIESANAASVWTGACWKMS